jgi:hypothetical protein
MRRRHVILSAAAAVFTIAGAVLVYDWRTGAIRRHGNHDRAPGDLDERPLPNAEIVIAKSARRLDLLSDGKVVHSFRIALGSAPEGDKVKLGDGRTPEGGYYVCGKNPRSKFYLALGLSYPNEEDAARGLRDGIITRSQHDRIVTAVRAHRQPPWDTQLGGAILIHGRGARSDWTLGCIALDDPDIKTLYELTPLGAKVRIEK